MVLQGWNIAMSQHVCGETIAHFRIKKPNLPSNSFLLLFGKRGTIMAANFKVSVLRKSASLYLKLMGDFDGSSAFDLIKLLRKNWKGIHSVFICTSGLRNIYPFGRDMFYKNLSFLAGKPIRLIFTGEKSAQMTSKRS
jgi:hypothetical protein